MSICYTGSNMLVCALSFDSQLSCAFYWLNVFQFSQMFSLFPLLLIASSIFPALLQRCSGKNQSTAWIATSQTNLPGCRTSPVDLAKPWEHLKPTCFAAARTNNMSLHTLSGRVVAPKSGLFACHHASKADSTLSTSKEIRCIQEDMAVGSTGEIAEANRPGYLH